MVENSTYTRFNDEARAAAQVAANTGLSVLRRHLPALNRDEEMAFKLLGEVDYQPPELSVQEIIDRFQDAVATFGENELPNVRDAQSFYEACKGFVDGEIYALFFGTNDEVSARISRDFLRDYVQLAVPGLKEKGLISDVDADCLHTLLRYFDDGIEAYGEVREHLLELSQGDHRSLIGYVHAQHPEHKVLEDSKQRASADAFLAGKAIEAYMGFIHDRGLEIPVGADANMLAPHYFLMLILAEKIAVEHTARVNNGRLDFNNPNHSAAVADTALKVVKQSIAFLEGKDLTQAFPDLLGAMRDTLRREREAPKDMPKLMARAITAAEAAAEAAIKTGNNYYATGPVKSEWFVKQSSVGTAERVKAHVRDFCRAVRSDLEVCEGMSQVVYGVNALATSMADKLIAGGFEPVCADVMQAYVKTLRKELAKGMDMPLSHSNQMALHAMDEAALVIGMAGVSNRIASDWVRYDTQGGWGSFYAQALMQRMTDTGKDTGRLDNADYLEVKRYATEGFRRACEGRGIVLKKETSMFIPYVYERAYDLAEAQLRAEAKPDYAKGFAQKVQAERSVKDMQPEQFGGPKDEEVHARAMHIIRDTLKDVSGKKNAKGKPIAARLDSVETLYAVGYRLERMLQALQEKSAGRMH